MQNHSSTMQLTSPISSENLMQSRLGELGLQSVGVGGAGDCFFRSVHINYMAITTIICVYVLLGFKLWETTQRDLLRAIPKIHGWDIWIICLFKVHGLMQLIIQAVTDALKVTIQIVNNIIIHWSGGE